MRSHKGNENGMTLVEILASLVILGIVFVGFMTVFPQMTKFNEKTETKLESMNLARNKLDEIRHSGIPQVCNGEVDTCHIEEEENGFEVSVVYTMAPDLKPEKNVGGQVALYQVHIKYYRSGQDEPISETFGYVRN